MGKKIMLMAGVPGGLILGVLLHIGFPSDLWTPVWPGDFTRGVLCVMLFVAAGFFLIGTMPLLEDWEVRTHVGPGPIYNPLSRTVPMYGAIAIIGAIVLVIRYLYLVMSK